MGGTNFCKPKRKWGYPIKKTHQRKAYTSNYWKATQRRWLMENHEQSDKWAHKESELLELEHKKWNFSLNFSNSHPFWYDRRKIRKAEKSLKYELKNKGSKRKIKQFFFRNKPSLFYFSIIFSPSK